MGSGEELDMRCGRVLLAYMRSKEVDQNRGVSRSTVLPSLVSLNFDYTQTREPHVFSRPSGVLARNHALEKCGAQAVVGRLMKRILQF